MVRTSNYRLNGEFVAEATRGDLLRGVGVTAYNGVSIDSRTLRPGQAFFAIRGPRHDGHAYVAEALARGACGLVVDEAGLAGALEAVAGRSDVFVVKVEDTTHALQDLARMWVLVMAPEVIAITGSVGKSTTKELLAAVLSTSFETHKSRGNLNNRFGLPLACLELSPRHQVVVVEMGASAPGEIAELCRICKPRVGVVTSVAPAHVEGFGSLDGVARAKAELVEALPEDGLAVLNADNPLVVGMRVRTRARVKSFGHSPEADVRIVQASLDPSHCTLIEVEVEGRRYGGRLAMTGTHFAASAAAALAVGVARGIDPRLALEAMADVTPGPHRLHVVWTGRWRVIDDSYNSSPASLDAALRVLRAARKEAGRAVAVLGDMLELGAETEHAHRDAGKWCVDYGVDLLIAVGNNAEHVAQGALRAGMSERQVYLATDAPMAVDMATALVREEDTVLVKGSRAMGLELVVEALTGGVKSQEVPRGKD